MAQAIPISTTTIVSATKLTEKSLFARVFSVDAYRGFVMLLMMAEVTRIWDLPEQFKKYDVPMNSFWSFTTNQQTHVEWRSLVLHDMIQPSFSFLVGVALVYSLASRYSKGQSFWRAALHAAWRSVLLIVLGIWLRSQHTEHTYFTFEDTLSQIGLGYFFLFLLGHLKPVWHWIAFGVILVGYWLAFIIYQAPVDNSNYEAVGVTSGFIAEHHPKENNSMAAHFNKNSNLAWAADKWLLNHFPYHGKDEAGDFAHNQPDKDGNWFHYNKGGYATLSFIPTLATMILGLIAGGWLSSLMSGKQKVLWFIAAGLISLAVGAILDLTGICPSVKRIWTPAWVLVSGGFCFLLLALFYSLIDLPGWTGWSYPLRVIGANSIVAYFLADALGDSGYLHKNLVTHFGERFFNHHGPVYHDLLLGTTILIIDWLILFWMYRKKIFIKI